MKTGRTLVELAKEVQRRAENKHDYVAKTEAITMEATDNPVEAAADADFDRLLKEAHNAAPDFHKLLQLNVGGKRFGVNEIAHDQISQHLQIPAVYYDRMRTENPQLLTVNVNTWLAANAGQKRMVRTLDNTARAFLSDKFRPIEHEDLCEAILPILLQDGRFDLMSMQVTDKKLYLKVVDKSVTRKLAETGNAFGDNKHKIVRIVAPAITISNSEVGHGALSVLAGIYDSFCSNLATFGESSMRRYHVGARHDIVGADVVALLSQQTQNLTNAALMSQVKDVVTGAFNPERFNALCDKVEGTTQDKVEKDTDIPKLIKLTGQKVGFTEGEGKGILARLIEGGDTSRFGVYNAVTRFSQDVESYDRASELERAGAAVVELGKAEWQRLLQQSAN
jgi:hypothetical protein